MKSKIISIVFISFFSVVLWVFVSFSGEYFTSIKFPIKVSGIPENQSIANQSINEVTLNLKGQGWQLAQLTFGRNPDFYVKANSKTGKQSLSLRNEIDANTWLSTSLQVIEIEPEKIEFTVEAVKSKTVQIESLADITFKTNFGLVSGINLSPDSVEITGPESIVSKINKVYTEKKKFENTDRAINESINLQKINFIEMSFEKTNIQFDVQKIVDKTFENILVGIRYVPASRELLLFPAKINVVLRGGINILGKLSNDDVKAYINYNQALYDSLGAIEPYVESPEYTTVIDKKPRKLEYIIKQF
ncbi:MAG: hypothetical protein KJ571_08395 [Bacteroidetes bacterium]|nr:hypothetical protein [Bacteroidota bacterium]